jgi:hypothetical protein
MAYTTTNFKTKKALKEAVKAGEQIGVFNPSNFTVNFNGTEYIEGPHYPEPHRWYAMVTIEDGFITKVK